MNILITGGTGLIGSAICRNYKDQGHNIYVLSRYPSRVLDGCTGIEKLEQIPADTSLDVVINLAGEPIADKRWSVKQKQSLCTSRIDLTKNLVSYLNVLPVKPRLLISGSAIGYYGTNLDQIDNEPVGEGGYPDQSFSSYLCKRWELEAIGTEKMGVRTCLLRTGIVLSSSGGALKKMLPPFKLGVGGPIGSGCQWMPWIHIEDMLGLIDHCIQNSHISGPVNAVAPNPVTNRVFSQSLGKQLKRPVFLTMPAPVIKLLMGQMGEELLLSGKKVVPAKAVATGYRFKYPHLADALGELF